MSEQEPAATVAIITRTRDRPRFLARCIRSILAQTYRDWIHVIVNDGGDETRVSDVVRQFGDDYRRRVVVTHHGKRLGMEAASNSGIRAADSTYVAMLDDDDTWHEPFLESMVGALGRASDQNIKGAVCQSEIVHETVVAERIVEVRREPLNPDLELVRLDRLMINNMFTNNAFLVHRSAFDTVGYFDESLQVLGDWDFNIRFFLRFDAVVLDRILARWHWRSDAASNGTDVNSVFAGENRMRNARFRLINEALRGNWQDDRKHLASLLVLGGGLDEVMSAVRRIEARQNAASPDLDRLHAQLERMARESKQQSDSLRAELDAVRRQLQQSIRDYSFLRQLRRAVSLDRLKQVFKRRT